jgi:predicted heme/steroid binding protein/uncharacterized membrane protein
LNIEIKAKYLKKILEEKLEIDRKELMNKTGKEGQPAHVAANGKIYDVTNSRLWKNGRHMNRHEAGTDLTTELAAAPHGAEVLERFPVIGSLKTESEKVALPLPGWLANFLEAYPFFKRHPHPMVVHFPMVFFIIIPAFLAWYYFISPMASLLDSIVYLHIPGTFSLPFAMLTGWLSWKVNYLGKPIDKISRKILFSFILLVMNLIVLFALWQNPTILANPQGVQWVIPILIFSYFPVVSCIGAQGGELVYPVH